MRVHFEEKNIDHIDYEEVKPTNCACYYRLSKWLGQKSLISWYNRKLGIHSNSALDILLEILERDLG